MRTTRKSARTKRPSQKREKIEIGSGNVFADLGFEDSEERLLRAKLASKIAQQKNPARKSLTRGS